MKEMRDHYKASNLLWKFLIIFVIVLVLFNLDYSKFTIPKKKEISPEPSKIEEKKDEESTLQEDLDLEDFLLDEIDKEILETVRLEQIKYYRKYIVNLSLLLRKFVDRENYEKEITFLLRVKDAYPKEVSEILLDLEAFGEKYLICDTLEYTDLKFSDGYFGRFLGKIFDIRKKNPKYKEMISEYKAIKDRLKQLENYFYSVEFLKAHLRYD